MSAFIVSDNHIDALVTFALDSMYFHDVECEDQAQKVGHSLVHSNYLSVNALYAERHGATPMHEYTFTPSRGYTAIELIKACDCYEYQAGDYKEYPESFAACFIRRVRAHLVQSLPGYDAAPWGLDDRKATRMRAI